jgi:hypothetical protein
MPFTGGGWTYSGDPSESTLDEVRFLIQDTDPDDKQISDEEIEYLIAENGGALQAAIAAAIVISAQYARAIDKAVGDLRISYSQRSKQYRDLADFLGSDGAPIPYAGGISVSDKQIDEDDTDRVSPAFVKGMHDRDGPRDRDPLLGSQ